MRPLSRKMPILVLIEDTEQWQRDTFTPGTNEPGKGLFHMCSNSFWYNVEILENKHKSFPIMTESGSKCFLVRRFSVFYSLVTVLSFVSQFLIFDLILQKVSLCCVSKGSLRSKLTARCTYPLLGKNTEDCIFSHPGKVMPGTKADKFKWGTRQFLNDESAWTLLKILSGSFPSLFIFTSGLEGI